MTPDYRLHVMLCASGDGRLKWLTWGVPMHLSSDPNDWMKVSTKQRRPKDGLEWTVRHKEDRIGMSK